MSRTQTHEDLIREIFGDDSLFGTANLSLSQTGLPFIVWISPGGDFRHGPHIGVSRSLRATPSKMTVVAIQPNVHVEVGPQ